MASGLAQLVLRPTAFMEHHAHNFNGKALLEKGKAQLIGSGTKKRNFVAATDVAGFALRALLDDPPPFRAIEIGGPGNYSNTEVAERYARAAPGPGGLRLQRAWDHRPCRLRRATANTASPRSCAMSAPVS